MKIFRRHLCDEQLLLLNDGDAHPRLSKRDEQHLLHCFSCTERMQMLRQIDQDLRITAIFPSPQMPDIARNRLQASLAIAAKDTNTVEKRPLWVAALLRPTMLLRVGTLAALLVVAFTYRQASKPLQTLMAAAEETGPRPDHMLTPGSAGAQTVTEVCRMNDNELDPPLPAEKQSAVFHAYRMDERAAKAYQVDYLISPQLGGNDSLKNLWPEPYHATVWNAIAKDTLETRLHSLVCSGELDLQSAQRDIATDWIAAYKKYFRTALPAETVAAATR